MPAFLSRKPSVDWHVASSQHEPLPGRSHRKPCARGRTMSRICLGIFVGLGASALMLPQADAGQADEKPPVVILETSMGKITIELEQGEGPDHGRKLLEVR